MIKDILIRQMNNSNVAVIDYQNEYTYEQIYKCVVKHVMKIGKIGSKSIGLYIDNSIDYIVGYFVIAFLDRIIIPIETTIKRKQLVSTIQYCDIDMIITNNKNYFKLTDMLKKENKANTLYIYNLDNTNKINFTWKNNLASVEKSIADVAIMLHTSGTTSAPKKVMLTHENLICNILSNINSLKLTEKDRSLIVLPMCFGYCNTSQFLSHFYIGASIVIYDGLFLPNRFFWYIDRFSCTNTTCIPSMLYLIANSRNKYQIKYFRYLCFGGGPIDITVINEVYKVLPSVGIIQTYGLTEASPRVTCLMPDDGKKKIGSVGKAIPGVCVKIFDEKDNELAAGKKGEIVVKGKNVMKGYYKKTQETKKVIRNGWLHTGDIGVLDIEGYLYVIGRKKNVIITGGMNVYPEEIEATIKEYQLVNEVVVLAKPHKILGEIPIAKITVRKKEGFDMAALYQYCRERLETQKIPKEIIIVDNIEKTYNGKIKRISVCEDKND